MFEKRLKQISISRTMSSGKEDTYYILTHKKHRREIYFKNSKEAILFMRPKFNSFRKKIIYFFLKTGLLQPFLKKIKLSRVFGDVIFIGGKISSFDLKKKEALFFPLNEKNNEFIRSKKFQKKVSEYGFAPQVYEINEKIPYSKEELLEVFEGDKYINIFKKIQKFYNFMGLKLSNNRRELLMVTLHGDFAKENILIKKGLPVFIDWHPYRGFIIGDLVNFFRGEKDLLKNKKFLEILKVFPQGVQENIGVYIFLNKRSKKLDIRENET